MPSDKEIFQLPQTRAEEFSQHLRNHLSPQQMQEVVFHNQSNGPSLCASHDFCDANGFMERAFVQVMGRSSKSASSADAELWGAAWALGKNASFARALRLVVWGDANVAYAYVIRESVVLDPRRDNVTQSEVDPLSYYHVRSNEVAALDRANRFLRASTTH